MLRTGHGCWPQTQQAHRIPLRDPDSVIWRTEIADANASILHLGDNHFQQGKTINAHLFLFGTGAALDSKPLRGANQLSR